MITAHAVYKNSDMTEGRGPMVLDKVFMQFEDAEAYANRQKGVMGRTPAQSGRVGWAGMGDWEVKPITILETLEEVDEQAFYDARERALSKLTSEELRALGLTNL